MRTRILLGVLASAFAVSLEAQASHHVDCAGPIVPACAVINRYALCHTPPSCWR
jgi:hypothetical protein